MNPSREPTSIEALPEISETFDTYYREAFGTRWDDLAEALMRPPRHVARLNPRHPEPEAALPNGNRRLEGDDGSGRIRLPPEGASFEPPRVEGDEPEPYYLLDGASVWAARALEVEKGDRVLDMCAAPGGKTLLIAADSGEQGFVVANDRSASRRARLHDVLDHHLPEPIRERIRVTGHDARRWGLHQQSLYDRVLVDAPCSGERHLIRDRERLREWSPGRPETMADRQYPMLCAALDAVRIGGRILYCTCALSRTENDGVVERMLERSPDRLERLELELPRGEPTEFGWRLLPDRAAGWGPMYVAGFECTA